MFLVASTLGVIIATVVAFLTLTIVLVALLLFAKEKLSPSGPSARERFAAGANAPGVHPRCLLENSRSFV